MNIENKEQAIEILQCVMPYPNQIKDYKFNDDSIDFTWRKYRYQLQLSPFSVYEKEDGMLGGTDNAILITQLIKIELLKRLVK